MKPLKHKTYSLAGTSLVLLVMAGAFFGAGQLFQSGGKLVESDLTERAAKAPEIHSLRINYPDGEVKLVAGTGDAVVFREYSSYKLTEADRFQLTVADGTAVVSVDRGKNFPVNLSGLAELWLEVTVPQSLLDELTDLAITTASGDVSLPSLTADQVELKTASGKLLNGRIKARRAHLTTVSGDMAGLTVQSDDLELGTTSGSIKDSSFSGKSLVLGSVSGALDNLDLSGGEVKINTVSGAVVARLNAPVSQVTTTSGDVSVELRDAVTSGQYRSISGDIRLNLPQDQVEVEYSTVSGRYEINLRQVRGKGKLFISTTSGDILVDPL